MPEAVLINNNIWSSYFLDAYYLRIAWLSQSDKFVNWTETGLSIKTKVYTNFVVEEKN